MRIKDWGKGVNKDQPPWELAPGFWSDCQNMRFPPGRAMRVGGIATVITPSNIPYWLVPYSSGASPLVAYAGTTKAYVHDGSSETEITRRTPAQTVTAFSRSSSTVTVTTGAVHGLSVGNSITVFGAPTKIPGPGGGTTVTGLNGTFNVASTPTTTSFTYTSTSSGSYTATASDLTAIGYIVNSSSTLNFTGTQDDKITGGDYNGVLIYNNPVDGLYYYDVAGSGRLVPMSSFGSYKAKFVRAHREFLIAGNITFGGVNYRHQVMWSASAEPGGIPLYWTASSTNDAGNVDKVSEKPLVDGLSWGDDFILYKGDARYIMRYIGGNDVFDIEKIGTHKDDGLLAVSCAANTPEGQVFLTNGLDVRIHRGGDSRSLISGRMLTWLRGQVDSTNRARCFIAINPWFNEAWVCFPQSGQSSCTQALIWNWETDAIGLRDLTNVTAGSSGNYPSSVASSARLMLANSTPKIGLVDSGSTDFGATITSTLERTGMDMDDPGFKTLTGSMPLFDASTNFTGTVYHGSSKTQDGTTTYTSGRTYTHNTTERVNAIANSGRYLAWKFSTTASDQPALRTIDFDISKNGKW